MALTTAGFFITTLRKKNFGIRFTRAAFFSAIACFSTVISLVENPNLWGSQMYRHVVKSDLIRPNDSRIIELEEAFTWWLDNEGSDFGAKVTYYGDNLTDISKPMEDQHYKRIDYNIQVSELSSATFSDNITFTEQERLAIVDFFIRYRVIEWTSDETTQGVSDHVPLASEALSEWHYDATWRSNPSASANRAKDDCDGIAVVTVSFLRRLEANGNITSHANIACGVRHWFSSIMVNETTPVLFLNHWHSVGVYGIFLDNNLPLYGQNILKTLEDGIIATEEDIEEFNFYFDYIWVYYPLVVAAAFLLGALATILLGYPRDYQPEDEKNRVKNMMQKYANKPKIGRAFAWLFAVKIRNPFARRHLFFWLNTIFIGSMLLLGISMLYFGISTPLFTYAIMFIYIYLFGLMFLNDRDIVVKAYKKGYKAITGRDFDLYGSKRKVI